MTMFNRLSIVSIAALLGLAFGLLTNSPTCRLTRPCPPPAAAAPAPDAGPEDPGPGGGDADTRSLCGLDHH